MEIHKMESYGKHHEIHAERHEKNEKFVTQIKRLHVVTISHTAVRLCGTILDKRMTKNLLIIWKKIIL